MDQFDALPQAGDAEAGAGGGQAGAGTAGRWRVGDGELDLRLAIADPHLDARAGCVLAHVRQCLADDPVHRACDHRRGQRGVTFLGEPGRDADGCRLGGQRGQACGRGVRVALGGGAQNTDQVPQLVQCLAARGAQVLGGAPGGLVLRGDAQRPGLQHHQADAVRHHVVHLTCQAGALVRPGLLGEQVALTLGPLGAFGEGPHHRVAGAEVQREQRPDRRPQHGNDDHLPRRIPDPGDDGGHDTDRGERGALAPDVLAVVERPVGRQDGAEGRPHILRIGRRQGTGRGNQERYRQREPGQDGDDGDGRAPPGGQREVGEGLDGQHGPGERAGVRGPPRRPGQRGHGVQQRETDRDEHVRHQPVLPQPRSHAHGVTLCQIGPDCLGGKTFGRARNLRKSHAAGGGRTFAGPDPTGGPAARHRRWPAMGTCIPNQSSAQEPHLS